MKFSSSLRDPVYGVTPITSIEQEVLKLPIMNRLKDIKQLGLAYLTFLILFLEIKRNKRKKKKKKR